MAPDRSHTDPTPASLLGGGERIGSGEYSAEYPPVPGSRSEYTTRLPEVVAGPAVRVGSEIAGYRIRRQIGRGGMGVVFEAEQLSLGRIVALKVLPPSVVHNARAVDRFRREANAVARLSHPRIVAVHGFDTSEDGLAWLAMEYVPGLDLSEVVDRLKTARTHGRRFVRISGPRLERDITEWAAGRKLIGTAPGDPRIADGIVIDLRNPFPMMAALVADAADALRHAHAHGVIHRDIKPSNLILAEDGRIKLSDFGLAKDVGAVSVTESGDFVGSPAYVSPEQASPRRTRVDERSDIYSLGVTLYELITLHQPFAGKNVAVVLRNILTRTPPPPSRLNPRIPRDLETIVLKAMEKDPLRRYQSAEELGEDLRRFLNFEPISARPLGALARAGRFLLRHGVAVALASMGTAIVVLSLLLLEGGLPAEGDAGEQTSGLDLYLEARQSVALDPAGLVRHLDARLSPAARRAAMDRLAAEGAGRLARGEHLAVLEMVELLDVQLRLGAWAEAERGLARAVLRELKVGLVAALREQLVQGRPSPTERRADLGALERLTRDADWQVCKNAAMVLGELGDGSSLGGLLDALVVQQEPSARVAVIQALGTHGDPGAVDMLADQLDDEDPWVRLAALNTLEQLAPPDLLPRIMPLASDPMIWIRHRYQTVFNRRREQDR